MHKGILLLFYFTVSLFTLNTHASNITAPGGLSLEITRPGFHLISKNLRKKLGAFPINHPIKNPEVSLPGLVKVKMIGLSAHTQIKDLNLYPVHNGLGLEITLDKTRLSWNEIRAENYFFPLLGTHCGPTVLSLNQDRPQSLLLQLNTSIRNRKVKLDLENFRFELEAEQYRVNGPSYCTNLGFFNDPIMRTVLHQVLAWARPLLTKTIENKINEAIAEAEKSLNKLTGKGFPLTIPQGPLSKKTDITLAPMPYEINAKHHEFSIKMALAFKKRLTPLPETTPTENEAIGPRYATLGIGPEVVNGLLNSIFPHNAHSMLLDPADNEQLATLLNARELSQFWPELAELDLDQNLMRGALFLPRPPEVNFDFEKESLLLTFSPFQLTLQVKEKGQWRNFYHLFIDTTFSLRASKEEDGFLLYLKKEKLKLLGLWPQERKPQNDIFVKDALLNLLTIIADGFSENGEGLKVGLPVFPLGDIPLTLGPIHFDRPFLKFDLTRARLFD